jgi:hypothetical protein
VHKSRSIGFNTALFQTAVSIEGAYDDVKVLYIIQKRKSEFLNGSHIKNLSSERLEKSVSANPSVQPHRIVVQVIKPYHDL